MILNPKIFRAYDIRGEAFIDFDEDGFLAIAHGFGQYLQEKFRLEQPRVFVSGDGRQSMPELYPAVIAGLKAAGCTVTWGGILPTPVNYFAFHEGDFDAAIQISASHNPAQDNGLKLTDRKGAVCGDEIQRVAELSLCHDCRMSNVPGDCHNACEEADFFVAYRQKLNRITEAQTGKTLVLDAGNGVAGGFYPDVMQEFGHNVLELYCDLNTTFPNHQPDPERPENLKAAQAAVTANEADFGFVYDGDGDRMGVILADGTALSADKIFYVLAADFLTRNPGASIVVDAMISQTLIEKLKVLGANVIMSMTGHSHIEQAMHEHKVELGGEQSGHFMFGENFYGHDDACLATLRFLAAVEGNPELLTEVTTGWPTMLEFSEKLAAPDEEKFKILEQVTAELLKDFPNAITLDGIRLDFGDDQWAIIRCSNTSPKIAVRIEARDQDTLDHKVQLLLPILERYI